jgi:hypothetical protein
MNVEGTIKWWMGGEFKIPKQCIGAGASVEVGTAKGVTEAHIEYQSLSGRKFLTLRQSEMLHTSYPTTKNRGSCSDPPINHSTSRRLSDLVLGLQFLGGLKPLFAPAAAILPSMPPPYTFSIHIGSAAARKMGNFQDLAAKLNMPVEDLMRQSNGHAPPSKALVKGLAPELDIDEGFLEKLAEEVRRDLGKA